MEYGIAVSNGTTNLETTVACIALKFGEEIIMSTFIII
jgi:dTDP-4-amino-4,6-dideoxygalactose transaminase